MPFFRRLVHFFSSQKPAAAKDERLPSIDLRKLEELIEFKISKSQVFAEALSHRSFVQTPGKEKFSSNERLEFLGDAILSFAIGEFLFQKHLAAPEGDLTKIRARLVNRKSLNVYARSLHLEDFVLMNQNSNRLGERGMENILADCFEAIIAAIYLDGGYEQARNFIRRQVLSAIENGSVKIEDENFKSQLLEYAQGEGLGVPRYTIINEEGPDHDRTFTIEVYLKAEPYGVGMGKSKKDAEQLAAEKALQKLQVI